MFIEHKAQPFALANKGSLSYPQPLLQSFRNSPFGYGAFAIIAADSECKILPLRPSSRGNLLASLAGSFFFRKNINPLRSNVFYYSSSSLLNDIGMILELSFYGWMPFLTLTKIQHPGTMIRS